jgi:hypothetical protein
VTKPMVSYRDPARSPSTSGVSGSPALETHRNLSFPGDSAQCAAPVLLTRRGTGLIPYLVFMGASHITGIFKRLPEWPLVSKITLACGPPMLGLDYFFSTQNFAGGLFMPGYIYIVVGLVAGYALRSLD